MSDELIINVNMAEMKVDLAPAFFRTVLGSCVGVFLYEPKLKIGGLIHIVLPEHPKSGDYNPSKYATSGIPALIALLLKKGADPGNLVSKICGGSRMFPGFAAHSVIDIGERNNAAVTDTLERLGIRIIAKDTGGDTGRKILADLSSGKITVHQFNVGEKVI